MGMVRKWPSNGSSCQIEDWHGSCANSWGQDPKSTKGELKL